MNIYPIVLSVVHTIIYVSQQLKSEHITICPTCKQNIEVLDERWVKKDISTWEFIQLANCTGCNSTRYIVLETIHT